MLARLAMEEVEKPIPRREVLEGYWKDTGRRAGDGRWGGWSWEGEWKRQGQGP